MDRDELLKEVTTEDVKKIMKELGSNEPIPDHHGNLYFQTICHCGNKHKLLYYPDSKNFMCYTNCGSMSLYDLISQVKYCDFSEAFKYVADSKGIDIHKKRTVGLKINIDNTDLEILKKHNNIVPKRDIAKLPAFNENVLNIFDEYYPNEWEEEGINEDIANYFGIRFYFNQFKCVIPHRDIYGSLVGIRGRNFLQREVEQGRKYIPITIQGLTYRYPTAMNLYGIYQNKDNIKKARKVILFESEKSVLKYGSIYGQENNISLATMSMNFTLQQRDLLLSLGVDEVILAWDKQYQLEYLDSKYKNTKEYKEFVQYIRKIQKVISMLTNYCNISVIFCWDERIDYKDAPIDKGKDIFEELLDERYLIESVNELEEEILNEI
ncbi:MAG: hypothetical protein ACRC1T_05100 [Clostridium chrysemydis]|uniref:hypothetical protein n=1 Tax=Clostridium chrysemydis TaxID=2665504 RepID=UPI003F380E69